MSVESTRMFLSSGCPTRSQCLRYANDSDAIPPMSILTFLLRRAFCAPRRNTPFQSRVESRDRGHAGVSLLKSSSSRIYFSRLVRISSASAF
eukprot:2400558-Pyramimonas_sp.AAC.1